MFVGVTGSLQDLRIALYTGASIIRGTVRSRYRRITDVLNEADAEHLVLTDVETREYGGQASTLTTPYAQVSFGAILFAVSDVVVDVVPELRTPKVSEPALVEAPPFTITGRIHVLPERDLGEALVELGGRFLPLTEATFWSDSVGEARTTARVVAVNHARTHILAPYRPPDRWGIGRGERAQAESAESAESADGAESAASADSATTATTATTAAGGDAGVPEAPTLPEMPDLPHLPDPPAMPPLPEMPDLPHLPPTPDASDR